MNSRRAVVFTLIEMLIAIAILGLSLSALYATRQNALSRTWDNARPTEGALFVQSLLRRAGTEWPRIKGSTTGDWSGFKDEPGELKIEAPLTQPPTTLPTVQVAPP